MINKLSRITSIALVACISFAASAKGVKMYKTRTNNNPIIANIFCADPTAVEFEGRLYVYGTCDEQQYLSVGASGKNTYEHIKSLVMLSTDDMVNWTYHGVINVSKIAPWAYASWAPSITSRVESDGRTHFYLYYSNSGFGVGVLTATSPVGPWTDPIGHSIVDKNTKGLGDCEAPFDPGVVIDDNGVGWLTFGGGSPNKSKGTDYLPGNARIVKLGSDMISIASDIIEIDTPYHFEANELNFINGTYVYTYNTNWAGRSAWKVKGKSAPTTCSMVYMTTKTPLDASSWVYQGCYFRNPGEFQMEYSNNHTHLQKYQGKYYLFYHSLFPQKTRGTEGGFRSLCVDEIPVDENALIITRRDGTKKGVSQIKSVNPYQMNQAETMANSAEVNYVETDETGNLLVAGAKSGAWILVKDVDFGSGAAAVVAQVSGKGKISVCLDTEENKPVATIAGAAGEMTEVRGAVKGAATGKHDVYFVFDGSGIQFDSWQFEAK
jgi:hypothetical protein